MNIENTILDSLEIVCNYDLSDDRLADALLDQARLMAGLGPDQFCEEDPDMF